MASKIVEYQIMRHLLISGLLALAMTSMASGEASRHDETLMVGRTNIFCVKAPCPWRGIAAPGVLGPGASGLLWAEDHLPEMQASPEDARRITDAWAEHNCLKIHGRMIGMVLQVDDIIGTCT